MQRNLQEDGGADDADNDLRTQLERLLVLVVVLDEPTHAAGKLPALLFGHTDTVCSNYFKWLLATGSVRKTGKVNELQALTVSWAMFREARDLYAYEFLQKMSIGLIAVFIPIYIVSQGRSVWWAFMFLVVHYGVRAIFSLPIAAIVARINVKRGLLVSYVFTVPGLLIVHMLDPTSWVIVVVAVLMAVGSAFHWVALHAGFAYQTRRETRGIETGKLMGIPRVANAFAPFVGGVVLASFGFGWLVAVSILFLLLSAVPLAASRDYQLETTLSLRPLNDRSHGRFAALFMLRGISRAVEKFLFPLYVFLIIGTVEAGAVGSMVNVGAAVFALGVGKLVQEVDERILIVAGAVISGAMYGLQAFVSTSVQALAVSFSAGFLVMLYFIPVFSNLTDIADEEDVLSFFAFRESFLAVGRLLVLAVGMYIIVAGSSLAGVRATFFLAAATTAAIALFANWLQRERLIDGD